MGNYAPLEFCPRIISNKCVSDYIPSNEIILQTKCTNKWHRITILLLLWCTHNCSLCSPHSQFIYVWCTQQLNTFNNTIEANISIKKSQSPFHAIKTAVNSFPWVLIHRLVAVSRRDASSGNRIHPCHAK